MTSHNKDILEIDSSTNDKSTAPRTMKRKKKEITDLSKEEDTRIERIRQVMKQEQHLANISSQHEIKMAAMKEEHLREFNYLQLKHIKELHEVEMEIKKAKLKAIKCQFEQKENIDFNNV